MKRLIFLFLAVLFSQRLFGQSDTSKLKDELIKADTDFSNMSKEKGRNAAFIFYVAEDGVMLRPNGYPIKGKDAIAENMKKNSDTTFTLTWKPLFADIAKSGELGYTYGTWDLVIKSEKGGPVHQEGTYASIWKKDKNGQWKFVLDVGNEGLKPKK